jgi:agmatinase
MQYITSKAIELNRKDKGYEAVNFISGKSFFVSDIVKDLLDKFNEGDTVCNIKKQYIDSGYSELQLESVILMLKNNKLILAEKEDPTFQLTKHTNSVFNIGFSDVNKLDPSQIVFVGIPFGGGNPTDVYCRDFPNVFRDFSSKYLSIIGKESKIRYEGISNHINFTQLSKSIANNQIKDVGNIFFINNEDNNFVANKISTMTSQLLSKECIPFILGGDHSVTYPVLKAYADHFKSFQVLHFDAHIDYKESKILNLYMEYDHFLLNHGSFINHCVKLPQLKKITQLGIRSLVKEDLTSHRINSFCSDEIFEKIDEINDSLLKDVPIYITLDIDFFDPSVAPATATPVINGFTFKQFGDLVNKILTNKQIIGIDLVEVNPNLDINKITHQLVCQLVLTLINFIKTN